MMRRALALLALATALAACGHYGAPVHAQPAREPASEAAPPGDAPAPDKDRHD
jgi:ABC-type glycerol-3-phosphate transport system substrate-binding protein